MQIIAEIVDFFVFAGKILSRVRDYPAHDYGGNWCNGSTPDSGSGNWGSNP